MGLTKIIDSLFPNEPTKYRGLPSALFCDYKYDSAAFEAECTALAEKVSEVLRHKGLNFSGTYKYTASLCVLKIEFSDLASIEKANKKIKEIEKDISLYTRRNANCALDKGITVEIPLSQRLTIGFKWCFNDNTANTMQCPLIIGQDTDNQPFYIDLAEAPHILVAGATGSGKSVCLNNIILSLIKYNSPKQLQLMLIDPKSVEFQQYRGLKHLAKPIITGPENALKALLSAENEMNKRYLKMAFKGIRNINEHPEMFPRLVIIIDELASLMMTNKKETEQCIESLAAKGRACGIHLIVATQNPTSKVITGRIKANIPTRLAFTTSSIADSRVILDYGGAEKLTGKGDGLYKAPTETGFKRFQSAYVSDKEIQQAVAYTRFGVMPK